MSVIKNVAFAVGAVLIALTITGVLPMALAALLEWLLAPLGGWAVVVCLAAFFGVAWLLLEAVM